MILTYRELEEQTRWKLLKDFSDNKIDPHEYREINRALGAIYFYLVCKEEEME